MAFWHTLPMTLLHSKEHVLARIRPILSFQGNFCIYIPLEIVFSLIRLIGTKVEQAKNCKDLTDMKYRSNRRFLATISTFVTIQYTAQRSALFFFYHNRFSGNTRSISTSCITVPSLTLKQVFSRNKKFNQASNNHSFSASISVLSFVPPPFNHDQDNMQ